jgi:hypothetical protein
MKHNHEALLMQAMQTRGYIEVPQNRERMGFLTVSPQGKWFDTVFCPSLERLDDAVGGWRDPATRTKTKTAAMQSAERDFQPLYRQLYMAFLRVSPLVTNEDLVAMGLPERRSGGYTPVQAPSTFPVCQPDSSTVRRIVLHFRDNGGDHRRPKPHGVHGAEICWLVSDTAQTFTLDDLTATSICTRSPAVFDFKEQQRGKYFYYVMRWENRRGAKGPFGLIGHTVIP